MRSNASGGPCDHDDIADSAAAADRADEKDREQEKGGR